MKPRLGDDAEDGLQLLGGLGVSVSAASGAPALLRSGGASVLKRQRENRSGAPMARLIGRDVLPPGVKRQ